MHAYKWVLPYFLILCSTELLGQEQLLPERIRQSIEKSLPLIERSSATYLEERECFGCHHQAMSIFVLTMAKKTGFTVDAANLQAQLDRTLEHLKTGEEKYLQGKGQGGKADTAGYALWALDVGGIAPNQTTAAVAEYLLLKNKDDKHWTSSGNRPPSEASDVTTTALALFGLRAYGTNEQQTRISEKRTNVAEWLIATQPKDTEERVFRLHGLSYLENEEGVSANDVATATKQTVKELLDKQRENGGWSQTDELDSDAYATGSALVALHEVDKEAVASEPYQRGVKFLVDTQLSDGSWHVGSRSDPFQEYFESGFPHGDDQFISMSASCWATQALLVALADSQ